ncbi:hypothetical protein [Rhodoferax sp. BLA1]|uniref:hypothetical protein n=1 Tax=Rhodoferax sp. BLA1 TaxID=2576062 RepID=UPI0015D17A2C|nr:hypothetical protein [Rhodoferax sp. BLA1]
MTTVFVQFFDASELKVVAVFGCAQDELVWPYQGQVDDSDPRYLAFISSQPTSSTEPDQRLEILGELAKIDLAAVRPARAVSIALAKGLDLPSDNADLVKLVALENQAIQLRADLAALPAE